MASIEIARGAPSFTAPNHVTWQDRDPPVGLADVSALSSDGGARYAQRLRLWRPPVAAGRVYLSVKSTVPDGTDAFGSGDDLSDAWEGSARAVVLSAPNGDFVIPGPQHPDAQNRDDLEPYQWNPPSVDDLEAWVVGYLALIPADQALFSARLDDGRPPLPIAAAVQGVAGSVTVAVTKQAPVTKAVAATVAGMAGSVTVAVTKQAPLTKAVAATVAGMAGSVTVAVTKQASGTKPVAATVAGRGFRSLLPPNASPLEVALEAATARLAGVDVPIGDLWDPQRCPADLLPWLAWALSVDYWDSDWTEAVKRQVIADSIALHRNKGSVGSVRNALRSSGYADAILTERVGTSDPDHDWAEFDVDLDIGEDQAVTAESLEKARTLVEAVAPASRHLNAFTGFRATVAEQIGVDDAIDLMAGVTVQDEVRVNASRVYDGSILYDGSSNYDTERDRLTVEVVAA